MNSVCSRCGAEIKHVFRLNGLDFGSECIQKMSQKELDEILGYASPEGLKQAVLREGKKHQVDFPESIPPIGCKAKFGNSTLNYEVIGYSKEGVKVSAIFKSRKTVSIVKWKEFMSVSSWIFDLS